MTRWFYTDPLAAAWMAKHFGMRIHDLSCRMTEREGKCEWHWRTPEDQAEPRLHVHPDSLPLLEPLDGDIGTDERGRPVEFWDGKVDRLAWRDGRGDPAEGPFRIIQRDGKPFHRPKREA